MAADDLDNEIPAITGSQSEKLDFRTARRAVVPRNLALGRPRNLFVSEDRAPIPSNDMYGGPLANNRADAFGILGPGVVDFTTGFGEDPGEIVITLLNADTIYPGDVEVRGDADAEIVKYIYSVNNQPFVDLDATAPFGGSYTVSGLGPGNAYVVEVYAVNDQDMVSLVSEHQLQTATPNPEPVGDPPTATGNFSDRNVVAGVSLVFTWSDYFTDADSYEASGITGGVQSGTGNVTYTIATPVVGVYTIQVEAENENGTTLRTIKVTVVAAVVAPVKIADLPSLVVPLGGEISVNLTSIFSGTSPTYSLDPDHADLKIEGGFLLNDGALDAEVATISVEVTATNTAGSAEATTDFGVTPAPAVEKMVPVIIRSEYRYGGTTWRTPIVTFPSGPTPVGKHAVAWTTGTVDENGQVPEANVEVSVVQVGTAGEYQIYMENEASNGIATPRTDFSIFGESEATRSTKLRFAYQEEDGDPWSEWSDAVTVPLVSIPTPTGTWLPWLMQWQAAFTGNNPGSRGMQFERGFSWNWGRVTTPVNRDLDIFGAQDVDQGWMSEDGGRSWFIPRSVGNHGNNEGGIYANSDDNIVVRLTAESAATGKFGGLYVSKNWSESYKRYNPTRVGPLPSFNNFMCGNNNRRNQNQIARRPQNADGTLTHAQRPIYILEQYNDGTSAGGNITRIFLWRSDDNLDTAPVMVKELTPIGDFASGGDALRYIDVDNSNGDVLVSGVKGAWLSQDKGLTWDKVYNGEVAAQFIKDGAAIIGVEGTGYGVLKTANVRTTGFTRPSGQNLPTTYKIWHMGVAYSNPDRIAVCANGASPKLSTDGGVTFNNITSSKAAGEDSNSSRYNIQQGPSGFYFHPRNELLCVAHTNQTMTRSTDGAVSFDGDDVSFFDGSYVKGMGFDRTNPNRFVVVQTDSVCQYMADSPMHINSMEMNKGTETSAGGTLGAEVTAAGGGTATNISGDCAALLPNDRILLGITRNFGGGKNVPVIVDIATQVPTVRGQPGNITTAGMNTEYHPNNSNQIFMGRFRVANLSAATGSITFTDLGKELLGYTNIGGDFVSYWTSSTGRTTTAVHQSTADNGGSASEWGAHTGSFDGRGFAPDPFVADRAIFTAGNQGEIFEMKKVGTSVVVTSMGTKIKTLIRNNLMEYMTAAEISISVYPVAQIIADYKREGLFYALSDVPGCAKVFESIDGGANWRDITENCPRGTNARIYVAKLSGELIFGSSNGTRVRKNSEGYPVGPNNNLVYNTWDTWYKTAPVLNPPIA